MIRTQLQSCDLPRKAEIARVMKQIGNALGAVDVLAACADIVISRLHVDGDESEWDKVMDGNLKSAFLLAPACARDMMAHKIRDGRIVMISSQASKVGEGGNGGYCVSKAGMNMLVQGLGLELAPYGVKVKAVCPGCVHAEMIQSDVRL